MNNSDFQQRAHTNPWDNTEDFQAALAEAPERQQLLDELQARDRQLLVNPPLALKHRLDAIPEENSGLALWMQWERALPLAASVLLALSVALYFWPQPGTDALSIPDSTLMQAELGNDILQHIRSEPGMLETDKQVTLAEVNEHMDTLGGRFTEDGDSMRITDIKDCWIKGNALHLVVKSQQGTVSVLIMDNAPVDSELPFEDDRFQGVVTPTPRGNLAIVSENAEGIEEVRQVLASHITW